MGSKTAQISRTSRLSSKAALGQPGLCSCICAQHVKLIPSNNSSAFGITCGIESNRGAGLLGIRMTVPDPQLICLCRVAMAADGLPSVLQVGQRQHHWRAHQPPRASPRQPLHQDLPSVLLLRLLQHPVGSGCFRGSHRPIHGSCEMSMTSRRNSQSAFSGAGTLCGCSSLMASQVPRQLSRLASFLSETMVQIVLHGWQHACAIHLAMAMPMAVLHGVIQWL